MREVSLPSGAVLKVSPAPFADAKALYQAVLREAKGVNVQTGVELTTLYKELFCIGFSSELIESRLVKCFEKCLYNNSRITDQTFEPLAARDDYMVVCMEVAKENCLPFAKSLFAEYQRLSATTENIQK